MNRQIKVLDCTLRDGGQGLIDINGSGIETEFFTNEEKISIAERISDSGIDIIEIGCIDEYPTVNSSRFALYDKIESLSEFLPKNKKEGQLFAGLFIGPDSGLDNIPDYHPGLCECVRVILRYSELQKSLDFCSGLAKKGYKVFIQPMLTMRYSDEDLCKLIDAANEMNAYALYFVDSFGYMEGKDIKRLFEFYDEGLNKNIYIGFHAHNNMHMAFENAKTFQEISTERNVIVDSCVMGMGQGAGNLQTELIINYLNMECSKNYDFSSILDVCEMLDKFKAHDMESWGYNPLRLIPALYKTAYKYAVSLKIQYGLSLREINSILKDMPDEMRHRHTKDNMEVLIRNYGGNHGETKGFKY